jgi:hypothetical protein
MSKNIKEVLEALRLKKEVDTRDKAHEHPKATPPPKPRVINKYDREYRSRKTKGWDHFADYTEEF